MIEAFIVKELAAEFGLSDLLQCDGGNIGRADNLRAFANAVAEHQRSIDAAICFAESGKSRKMNFTNDWSPYIEGLCHGADGCSELIKAQGE